MAAFEGVFLPDVRLPPDFTAIVTGGHCGMGYEMCKYLLHMGSRVVITCDTPVKGRAAALRLQADLMEMRQVSVDADAPGGLAGDGVNSDIGTDDTTALTLPLEIMLMDPRSLTSVNNFIERFKRKGYPLNLLVCGDGVVSSPQEYTENGNELHLQYNYLSHFLLITSLLPVMRNTASRRAAMRDSVTGVPEAMLEDCRVIIVANRAMEHGVLAMKNMQGKTQYNADKFYSNSQFYLVMLMYMLHRRMHDEPISVFAVNNGLVDKALRNKTEDPMAWGRVYSTGRSLGKIFKNMTKNVSSCLKVAVTPEFKGLSGTYFVSGIPYTPTSTRIRDPVAQEALWGFSLQALKQYTRDDDVASLTLTEEQFDQIMSKK